MQITGKWSVRKRSIEAPEVIWLVNMSKLCISDMYVIRCVVNQMIAQVQASMECEYKC